MNKLSSRTSLIIVGLALVAAVALFSACGGAGEPQTAVPATSTATALPTATEVAATATLVPGLTEESLRNGAYDLPDIGEVQLQDGNYEHQYGDGATQVNKVGFMQAALGDLTGDGTEDAAVILWANTGGSGTFIYLVPILADGPTQAGSAFLGDRVEIEDLSLEPGRVTVRMLVAGPTDPECCPSQKVSRTYSVEGGEVTLLSETVEAPSTDAGDLTEDVLRNAAYDLPDLGPFQLAGGEYRHQYGDGATQVNQATFLTAAFGDLDGDGARDAAAVLATDLGGSGTFLYLAAMLNQDGQPVQAGSILLGDRVQVQALTIEDGNIVLKALAHGPDDPMCCPSQQATRTYGLQDGALELLTEEIASPAGDAEITDIIWTWQGVTDEGGQSSVVVPYPPAYRLQLSPDGSLSVQADCNMAAGSYTLDGDNITLQMGPTTLAECQQGSFYDQYLEWLGRAVEAAYISDGDTLTLTLADGSDMQFARLFSVTGEVVTDDADLPDGAMIDVRVLDVSASGAEKTVGGLLRDAGDRFPINFEAPYDLGSVNEDGSYVLRVAITDADGNPLFTGEQDYPVITQDHPTYGVQVRVVPVEG